MSPQSLPAGQCRTMQLLLLLLLGVCQRCVHGRVSVSVSPSSSQYFEYDKVSLSCEHLDSEEWTVWRYTTQGQKLSPCGSSWGDWTASSCQMKTVKPTDSGVYWCQSQYKDSSNTVNITVTDRPVILQSPARPVAPGEDVTLRCKTNHSSSNAANFFKNGSFIGSQPAGLMTIRNFSWPDEGAYRCVIDGQQSDTSWLLLEDDGAPALLTASPDLAQLREYDNLFLSCGDDSSSSRWKVLRYTSSASGDKISSCEKWGTPESSGCRLITAKKHDNATYWCESPTQQRSNSLDIALYDLDAVILRSPVLPVAAGQNVTLSCETKTPSRLPADFYKDSSLIGRGVEGQVTLHHVSWLDEGLYRCVISGAGESAASPLLVRDPRGAAAAAEGTLLVLAVSRHLLVVLPYCIATGLMLSVIRRRPSGRKRPVSMAMSPTSNDHDQYDDVAAGVTTEHRF